MIAEFLWFGRCCSFSFWLDRLPWFTSCPFDGSERCFYEVLHNVPQKLSQHSNWPTEELERNQNDPDSKSNQCDKEQQWKCDDDQQPPPPGALLFLCIWCLVCLLLDTINRRQRPIGAGNNLNYSLCCCLHCCRGHQSSKDISINGWIQLWKLVDNAA